ncbi:MAG: energy-coupling factor transporter ATPase [Candidatus Latescibacterota bacterium]
MIQIKDLCFQYGDHKALDGINLEIREGEWIAVMGANGSGKTTLARCLNGLLLPTGGDVLVDGYSVSDEASLWDVRKRIGMVFQNPDNQIVSTMVEREIAFGLENLGIPTDAMHERVQEALVRFDLMKYRRHPPHKLSGGEKQRLAIASVWAMRPQVMVLDEPSSLLDPKGRREIAEILRSLDAAGGQTILHITQFPEEAMLARRVLIMSAGKIVMDGPPEAIFCQVAVLEHLGLDVPFAVRLADMLRAEGIELSDGMPNEDTLIRTLELLPWTTGSVRERESGTVGVSPSRAPSLPSSSRGKGFNISLEGISYWYNRGLPMALKALSEVTATIEKGQFVALIGPTGSGKSTLMQHFNGLLKPSDGRVLLDGIDLWSEEGKLQKVPGRVGLVFQFPEFQLFEESVAKDVAFGPRNLGWTTDRVNSSVEKALTAVGLDVAQFGPRSPMALSEGEKRRVAIAGILAMEPDVLALDEPTSGLDPRGARQIVSLLKALHAQGRTIVLISHDMDLVAEVAESVMVLDGGRLWACDTPEAVFGKVMESEDIGLEIPRTVRFHEALSAHGISWGGGVPMTMKALSNQIVEAFRGTSGEGKESAHIVRT